MAVNTENDKSVVGRTVEITEFNCVSCKTIISTRLPDIRVMNAPEFSSLTMVHQYPVKCTNCETYYIPLLNRNGMNLILIWKQVEVLKETKESNKGKEVTTKDDKPVPEFHKRPM